MPRVNLLAGIRRDGVADSILGAAGRGWEEVFVALSYCTRDVDEALEIAAVVIERAGA